MWSARLGPVLSLVFGAWSCTASSPEKSTNATSSATVPTVSASAQEMTAPAVQSAEPDPRPRIYSKRRHVWIQPSPSTRGPWIGFLGLGGSTALRKTEPVRGDGCAAFYAIEPRGYVCLDSRTTLDPQDLELQAIQKLASPRPGPWPFDYGESRQTPRYWTLPSTAEQRQREWRLVDHLALVSGLRQSAIPTEKIPVLLRGIDPTEAGVEPPKELTQVPVVHEYRSNIPAGSMISWTSQFDAEGRTWLLTPDLALVPKDKVAPYARSTFEGVRLDEKTTLPIAFVRFKPRPKYQVTPERSFRKLEEQWPRLAWVGLTGNKVSAEGKTFLETSDKGLWIDQADATIVRPAGHTPWGEAVVGREPTSSRAAQRPTPPASSRGTWIEVSVHGGWMIAYERNRPVLATLVSPGRGQMLRPGDEESVESATPPGVFNIQGKYLTSTMAVTEIVHFDVTFAMPFSGTIALHSAYSHDHWGQKASLGCVNLSPIDAFWLFHWAEPVLPEGWHGVSVNDGTGYATVVVVHF